MRKDLEQCRTDSVSLCDRLLTALEENREDARLFFGGEVYRAYETATERAKNKVKKIKSEIRNLY